MVDSRPSRKTVRPGRPPVRAARCEGATELFLVRRGAQCSSCGNEAGIIKARRYLSDVAKISKIAQVDMLTHNSRLLTCLRAIVALRLQPRFFTRHIQLCITVLSQGRAQRQEHAPKNQCKLTDE
eukprot:6179535-Pleurochrysis_carterae.AAC.1